MEQSRFTGTLRAASLLRSGGWEKLGAVPGNAAEADFGSRFGHGGINGLRRGK